MRQYHSRNTGFTLIEIMVVVVIVGILAAIIVPNVLGNKEQADQKKAVADLVALENALTMYKLNSGTYPTEEQGGLQALVIMPNPPPRNYPTGGYLKRLPKDPWGNSYVLENPARRNNNLSIELYSLGPNILDDEDDIGNWNLGEYQSQ